MSNLDLPKLPYADGALAPVISAETISFHYGKHHAAYVANLAKLLPDSDKGKSLEDVIRNAEPGPVFNNAAQIWNHTFYWHSMSPGGGGEPDADVAEALTRSFGSVDAFRQTWTSTSTALFGSGWVWLVRNPDGGLAVVPTKDADLPLVHGQTPLLVIDVWEHAYYIDHRNNRGAYVNGWLDKLVNWEFAAKNLADAG